MSPWGRSLIVLLKLSELETSVRSEEEPVSSGLGEAPWCRVRARDLKPTIGTQFGQCDADHSTKISKWVVSDGHESIVLTNPEFSTASASLGRFFPSDEP